MDIENNDLASLQKENSWLKSKIDVLEKSLHSMGVFRNYTDISAEASWVYDIIPAMPPELSEREKVNWILENSRLVDGSSEYILLHGYETLDEIIEHNLLSIWKNNKEEIKEAVTLFIKNKYQNTRLEIFRRNIAGDDKWLEINMYGVFDDLGMIALIGTQQDITEKKIAQLALKESEERFRNILNSAADAVYLLKQNGDIIEVNLQSALQTGYTKANLLTMNIKDLDPSFRDPEMILELWKTLSKNNVHYIESTHYRKDGTVFPVEINISKVKIGSSFFILCFVRDFSDRQILVSELKLKNEELEAYNEELEATTLALKESNHHLVDAKQKAEESDRLKTAFLQNLSHEIRTPLNGILGFSSILQELANDKDMKYYTNIIVKSGEQLLGIVDDIVDLSKIETGQVVLKKEIFDIREQLLELYHFFLPLAAEKKLQLVFNFESEKSACIINTDKTKFKQIISNLIRNAIKFTRHGSISFGFIQDKSQVKLWVQDTGIGIAPENHKLIFERFRQVETGMSRGYGGTGLGLTISRALSEIMGGSISVDSGLGKGTTFYVALPCNVVHPADYDYLSQVKGATVLIVEDEKINIDFIEAVLSKYSIKTLTAMNGEDAIKIYNQYPEIDIVLMDIRMPGMNGYQVTNIIKQINPGALVIAQTAFALAEDRQKALEAGFDDYISKPMIKENLLTILEKHLRTKYGEL